MVGSGFGGSVAALRAVEKGYSVCVLEAGRRFGPDDFPRTNWDLRRYLYAPRFGLHGIQRLTLLHDVLVLSGAGVGGGSLVYANTLYEPPDATLWRAAGRDGLEGRARAALRRPRGGCSASATGAVRDPRRPRDAPGRRADGRRRHLPAHRGRRLLRRAGQEVADPYFGGDGPRRTGCIHCGGCMVGCRHGAKNTLDKNYLYLAEQLGARRAARSARRRS